MYDRKGGGRWLATRRTFSLAATLGRGFETVHAKQRIKAIKIYINKKEPSGTDPQHRNMQKRCINVRISGIKLPTWTSSRMVMGPPWFKVPMTLSGHLQYCKTDDRVCTPSHSIATFYIHICLCLGLMLASQKLETAPLTQFKVTVIPSFGQVGEGRNTQGQQYRDQNKKRKRRKSTSFTCSSDRKPLRGG